MEKTGKIKWADREKGYGYIVADETDDPTDTILFESDDAESEMDDFSPGTVVVFEVDDGDPSASAKQVRTKS